MKLSGEQRMAISQALLDAFSPGSLEIMVSLQLDERLDQIAGGGNQTEVVHSLIRWAEGTEKVKDLIDGACLANPGNGRLQALKMRAESEDWFGAKPVADDAAPILDIAVPQIKRKALADRLALLSQQYEATNNQLNTALSAADSVKLQRLLDDLEQQMQAVETDLSKL